MPWPVEEVASPTSRVQSTVGDPSSPPKDDYEAAMDSLSPLVEEIASGVNLLRGDMHDESSPRRASTEDAHTSPEEEGVAGDLQSVELARLFSTRDCRLAFTAPEIDWLKVTVDEFQGDIRSCEECIAKLNWERADSKKKMGRLQLEVREAKASKARMAAENGRLTSRTNGAILAMVDARGELKNALDSLVSTEGQLEEARSLLAEAEEARTVAVAEAAEKNDAMACLQLLYTAKVARGEKHKELAGLISFSDVKAARDAEREKELTGLQTLLDTERACRAEREGEIARLQSLLAWR
ncbi:uncharacterized protein LOC132169506 [Corylus avellana]|uniref:uncharacterized protein LOC132169506 n=1 Tax=Corylus avellana TaxID=13451 RepID=UPI002869F012|nr:uncharacterized protein LOC132169506 [Corylus avellana]